MNEPSDMNEKLIQETAAQTKAALIEGLQEVFGDGDSNNGQMKVLVHRIPILCTRIDVMDKNIEKMKDDLRWIVRLVLGAVVLALIYTVIPK